MLCGLNLPWPCGAPKVDEVVKTSRQKMRKLSRTKEAELNNKAAEMQRLRDIAHTYTTPEEKQLWVQTYRQREQEYNLIQQDLQAYVEISQHASSLKSSLERREGIVVATEVTKSLASVAPASHEEVVAEFRLERDKLQSASQYPLIPGGVYARATPAEIEREFDAILQTRGKSESAHALSSPAASSVPVPSSVYDTTSTKVPVVLQR